MVLFHSVKQYCSRSDGLAVNIDYALLAASTLVTASDFAAAAASSWLSENLDRIKSVWVWTMKRLVELSVIKY